MNSILTIIARFAVLSISTAALALLLAACSGRDSPLPSAEQPVAAAAEAGGTVPVAGMPALPAPSALPRQAAALEPRFYADGNSGGNIISSNRVDHEAGKQISLYGQFNNFEPDSEPGEGLERMAWCCYYLSPLHQVNGSKRLRLFWTEPPVDAGNDLWIGLSDFSRDTWIWRKGPVPGQSLSLEDCYDDCMNESGAMYVIVLLTGHDCPSLDHLLLGDALILVEPSAEPYYADLELDTVIHANARVFGGFPERFDYDFEGDGVWDVLNSSEKKMEHTYSGLEVYHPKVRVWNAEGENNTGSTDVYVIDPANAPPSAVLWADVLQGSAPLTVKLDGRDSSDFGAGQIIKVEWDLDGDNLYELNTGTQLETTVTLMRFGQQTLRMRITDDDLATAKAFVNVNVKSGFDVQTIAGAAAVSTSEDVELCFIGEGASRRPAFLYRPDAAESQLRFQAAANDEASLWESPVIVPHGSGYVGNYSLANVAGNAAVAYTSHEQPQACCRYIRALNESCSLWSQSVIAMPDAFGIPTLTEVEGHPSIVYADQQAEVGLFYVRSSDSAGQSWPEALPLADANYVENYGKATIYAEAGEAPRILIGERSHAGEPGPSLMLYTGADPLGSAFDPGVQVLTQFAISFPATRTQNHRMFAFRQDMPGGGGFYFLRASSLSPGAFEEPALLDEDFSCGMFTGLATLHGFPMIAYTKSVSIGSTSLTNLYIRMATTSTAAAWGPECSVDTDSGQNVSMLTTLTGRPVMVYSDWDDNELRTAHWEE